MNCYHPAATAVVAAAYHRNSLKTESDGAPSSNVVVADAERSGCRRTKLLHQGSVAAPHAVLFDYHLRHYFLLAAARLHCYQK